MSVCKQQSSLITFRHDATFESNQYQFILCPNIAITIQYKHFILVFIKCVAWSTDSVRTQDWVV